MTSKSIKKSYISFNEDGICDTCKNAEIKNKIKWEEEEELKIIK